MPIYQAIRDVEGWLSEPASDFTERLITHQPALGVRGPIAEIGVHKGKYLSLLYGASIGRDDKVIGIDGFFDGSGGALSEAHQLSAKKTITTNVQLVASDLSRLVLHAANSLQITKEGLAKLVGGPISFISVDGGHDYKTVYHDLSIVFPNLAAGGVAALDDVFNSIVPGVAEAVCKYFGENRNSVATFATCGNKVFVTTPSHHKQYLELSRSFVNGANDQSYLGRTRRLLEQQKVWASKESFFGCEVATFLN
jgi:Methyltransferase domain